MTPGAAADAHVQNATAYALPRVHEASRQGWAQPRCSERFIKVIS